MATKVRPYFRSLILTSGPSSSGMNLRRRVQSQEGAFDLYVAAPHHSFSATVSLFRKRELILGVDRETCLGPQSRSCPP